MIRSSLFNVKQQFLAVACLCFIGSAGCSSKSTGFKSGRSDSPAEEGDQSANKSESTANEPNPCADSPESAQCKEKNDVKENKKSKKVIRPQNVSGAYLTCAIDDTRNSGSSPDSGAIGCRLQDQQGNKVGLDGQNPRWAASGVSGPLVIEDLDSMDSWHVLAKVPDGYFGEVKVHLSLEGEVSFDTRIYVVEGKKCSPQELPVWIPCRLNSGSDERHTYSNCQEIGRFVISGSGPSGAGNYCYSDNACSTTDSGRLEIMLLRMRNGQRVVPIEVPQLDKSTYSDLMQNFHCANSLKRH